jgi:hypothetical protein
VQNAVWNSRKMTKKHRNILNKIPNFHKLGIFHCTTLVISFNQIYILSFTSSIDYLKISFS